MRFALAGSQGSDRVWAVLAVCGRLRGTSCGGGASCGFSRRLKSTRMSSRAGVWRVHDESTRWCCCCATAACELEMPSAYRVDRIDGNRLFLYTAKTGVPVNTILPDFVLESLDACPKVTDKYFFWNGRYKLDTIVGSWRKRLGRLFELAEVGRWPRASFPRYIRRRTSTGGCANRTSYRCCSGIKACGLPSGTTRLGYALVKSNLSRM